MAENDNDDDENDFDEDHTALSQLVAQVEESFDTSSSEEDEEVDNVGMNRIMMSPYPIHLAII